MTETAMIPELRKVIKRLHDPLEVTLVCSLTFELSPLEGKEAGARCLC